MYVFKTVFWTEMRGKYPCKSFLTMHFSFLNIFMAKREQKLTKQANLTVFLPEYPPKGVITCRFEFN